MAGAASSIESLAAELDALKTALDLAVSARRAAENSLAASRSRLEVLLSLEASGEGLGEATRAVLQGLDNPGFFTSAISGAVASLLDVKPEYVNAIEGVLGDDLRAVFFKDGDVAESALKALENGDYGRGRIFSRAENPGTAPASLAYLPREALAWAVHCVRMPEDLRPALLPRLSDVAVVPDMDTALRLAAAHPRLGFATLAGSFIPAGGIAAAGRSGQEAGGALLRKNEIAKARGEVDAAGQALDAAARSEEDARSETARVESALAETRQWRQSLQVELSGLRGELSLLDRQAASEKARHQSLLDEISATDAQICGTRERIEEFAGRLAMLAAGLEEIRARRMELERLAVEAREREREENDSLNEVRLRVATERQRRENLQRQREPMAARVHELAELLASRTRAIENHQSRISSLEAEISELEAAKIERSAEIDALDARLAALMARRAEARESANAIESELRAARHRLQELQEQAGKFEIRSTQLDLRKENLREHALRRYSIEIAEFEPDGYALAKAVKEHREASGGREDSPAEDAGAEAGEIPWEEIARVVSELTAKIDAMGPVNLDAIQEYEELEQRYQFLEQQNTDLANSKTELLEVISRINKTTREMFSETFFKIRENFQEMFTELFGGGKANLLLLDESDPLESGIEIIAKPPGKQLQSISLLSGGEKTMTAVSLLFAIYMVKPSPFCVLDEMDAPLDESNISRFIKILDRFIGQSQFVVITHNKRTISRADLLYGVTMEEHGVSKLVGVRFQNAADSSPSTGGHGTSVAEAFGKSGNLHSETQSHERPRDFAEEPANLDA